jgi:hypothetical protein
MGSTAWRYCATSVMMYSWFHRNRLRSATWEQQQTQQQHSVRTT